MAFLKLLSSIVLFTATVLVAEDKEERYEDLVRSSMESVVSLNEVISSFSVQLAQISTSLFDVKLTLEETKNSVRSLEQKVTDQEEETLKSVKSLELKITDQEAETIKSVKSLEQEIVDLRAETSVIDDEVSDLTTLIAETSAKVDDMEEGSKEGEVMIISGEQPAGDESCMKVCAGSTGRSTTDWTYYNSEGIYEDVDISDCGFTTIPTVTTAIEGTGWHWLASGTSSIYSVTTNSFRIYLQHSSKSASAEQYKWNVEWIAVGYTC